MPNLKEVRVRIASVNSIKQITSAMKMVSASKLRKVQNIVLKLRPYSSRLTKIMQDISTGDTVESPYTEVRPPVNILFIVVTSNKGLCGSFNSNIIKETINQVKECNLKDKHCKVSLFCIGKRASDFFKRGPYNMVGIENEIFDHLSFDETSVIAEKLMEDFTHKKYDRIEFIYNGFKNSATQIVTVEPFLPIITEHSQDNNKPKVETNYIFEPSKEDIMKSILPLALRTQFYKVILNSFASEHGARMVTMQKATDNASELLKDLQLSYNKARQAAITNELIEIISGANALHG